jgi:RNA recognition motif-containing protein
MGTKLYVGNLSFNTTETDLQDLFAGAGPVQEVTLMQDKFEHRRNHAEKKTVAREVGGLSVEFIQWRFEIR